MVAKAKLRLAIASEKGVDFAKLKQEKHRKAALKRKRAKAEQISAALPSNDDGDEPTEIIETGSQVVQSDIDHREHEDPVEVEEEREDEQTELGRLNLDAIDDSDTSDSSIGTENQLPRKTSLVLDECQLDEDDEIGDIPVSDLDELQEDDVEDLIPHTRLTINNTAALQVALDRISIPTGNHAPFASHQSVVSNTETAISIPDVSDDLQRELAFYSQCLDAARRGRSRLLAEGVAFSRPADYFAEMVKEDAHMEKVKAKLVEEASAKKASAEARKLRDLKKFGKQVQVAKIQERQRAKREALEKIKTLKRKRQVTGTDLGTNEADMFDVGVDNEIAKYSQRSGQNNQAGGVRTPNAKRQKKNEKYGFGGKKRHAKSGDAVSSGDLSGFDAKRMKAAGARNKGRNSEATRPGKARRRAMATRKATHA